MKSLACFFGFHSAPARELYPRDGAFYFKCEKCRREILFSRKVEDVRFEVDGDALDAVNPREYPRVRIAVEAGTYQAKVIDDYSGKEVIPRVPVRIRPSEDSWL